MKRLAAVLAVATLLVAAPVTHLALAKKAPKVDICHVNSANDVFDFGTGVVSFGKVISVSENAVPAHEAHGDSQFFFDDPLLIEFLEDALEVNLPNADCVFIGPPAS